MKGDFSMKAEKWTGHEISTEPVKARGLRMVLGWFVTIMVLLGSMWYYASIAAFCKDGSYSFTTDPSSCSLNGGYVRTTSRLYSEQPDLFWSRFLTFFTLTALVYLTFFIGKRLVKSYFVRQGVKSGLSVRQAEVKAPTEAAEWFDKNFDPGSSRLSPSFVNKTILALFIPGILLISVLFLVQVL